MFPKPTEIECRTTGRGLNIRTTPASNRYLLINPAHSRSPLTVIFQPFRSTPNPRRRLYQPPTLCRSVRSGCPGCPGCGCCLDRPLPAISLLILGDVLGLRPSTHLPTVSRRWLLPRQDSINVYSMRDIVIPTREVSSDGRSRQCGKRAFAPAPCVILIHHHCR